MNSPRKPSVLFVFYTHTEQSRRVADAMAGVLRERGCDVSLAGIEFTDPRYAGKFDRFPFRHAVPVPTTRYASRRLASAEPRQIRGSSRVRSVSARHGPTALYHP